MGEADAAGDAVELGDGEAVLREHEVGADDERQVGAGFLAAGVGDEFGRFAAVEVVGDPRGLLAGDGAVVKLVAGALEKVEPVAELGELVGEAGVDDEGLGGDEPVFVGKKPLGRLGGADGGDAVGRGGHAEGASATK